MENKFKAFGEIRNARILLDPATQMGTGVGFLLYATRNEAEKACQVSGQLYNLDQLGTSGNYAKANWKVSYQCMVWGVSSINTR